MSFSVLYTLTSLVKAHICLEMNEVLTSLCNSNRRNRNNVMENIELKYYIHIDTSIIVTSF